MTDFVAQLDSLFDVAPEAAFNGESKVGDSVTGFIESIKITQAWDSESRRPATWEDGRPQEVLNVVVETEGQLRTVYIKTWGVQRKALATAVRNAGGRKVSDVLIEGSEFTAKYVGDEKATVKGYDDTKLYEYTIG
jgi:hypothetical protein